MPDLENLDRAYGGPTVHPAARRRGIGRALLRHEAGRATANGRTLFGAQVLAGSPGEAFAVAMGARLDLEEVRRIQYLREIAPGTVAALRATAERAATGYSLVSWTGPTPDEYCGAMAEVFNAFNDAPHGENEEPEYWDADRVRERTGNTAARRAAARLRRRRVARRDRRDGRLQRGAHRPRLARLGIPAAHGRDPAAQGAPARAAREDRDAGPARLGRAAARVDPDRERRLQRAHDRGQRAARLQGGRAGLELLRDRRLRHSLSDRPLTGGID